MGHPNHIRLVTGGLALGGLLLKACAPATTATPTTEAHTLVLERDPDVPELPFEDNPDPSLCGIPAPWGQDDPAWLSGYYEGELIQPTVFLYDSHLRLSVRGAAPTGTEVRILLHQSNPTLDFYLVKTVGLDPKQERWVPAPFLSFEPVD